MDGLGLSPNPYAQALGAFPEGLYSLVQNGQYPSIAGGASSGFTGAYQPTPLQLQALAGFGQSMQQKQQPQQMQPVTSMPISPFTPITNIGMLPVNQMAPTMNYRGWQ